MKKTNLEQAQDTFNGFIQHLKGNKPLMELESQKGENITINWGYENQNEWECQVSVPKVDLAKWIGYEVVNHYDMACIVETAPTFNPYDGYDEMEIHTELNDFEFDWNDEIEPFCIDKGIYDKGGCKC